MESRDVNPKSSHVTKGRLKVSDLKVDDERLNTDNAITLPTDYEVGVDRDQPTAIRSYRTT